MTGDEEMIIHKSKRIFLKRFSLFPHDLHQDLRFVLLSEWAWEEMKINVKIISFKEIRCF